MGKKKEMGFIEKFGAAGEELEKEINDSHKGAMIMIAIDGDEGVYSNVLGENRELATILSYVALSSDGFEEIIRNSIKAIDEYREKYNK